MAKKKAKKSKTLGKKDLKKTKGGLLPAVNVAMKDLNVNGSITVQKVTPNIGSIEYYK